MRIRRDEELLARLGSGRLDLVDLDEVTRRVAVLLWALRSTVDSEPISLEIGQATTGRQA